MPLFTTRVEVDCYTNNFPGLPRFKKIVADKHVITELPLVPFVIINSTSLTASVCMKLRFKSKVTRGFLSRRLATRIRRFVALSRGEKSRKTSGTRVILYKTHNKVLAARHLYFLKCSLLARRI